MKALAVALVAVISLAGCGNSKSKNYTDPRDEFGKTRAKMFWKSVDKDLNPYWTSVTRSRYSEVGHEGFRRAQKKFPQYFGDMDANRLNFAEVLTGIYQYADI